MNNPKGVLLGTLIGTFIGSLAVVKRKEIQKILEAQSKTVAEKTKQLAEYIKKEAQQIPWNNHEKKENGHFWSGSALGLIAGAGATLLLTPKNGKAVRNQLSQLYSDVMDNTHDVLKYIQNSTSFKKKPKVKKALAKTKKKMKTTLTKTKRAIKKKVKKL